MTADSPNTERLNAFSDAFFCSRYYNSRHGPAPATCSQPRCSVRTPANRHQLRSQLALHRHRLGEPSPSSTLCKRSYAPIDLSKPRSSAFCIASAVLDSLDREFKAGAAARHRLRRHIRPGERDLSVAVQGSRRPAGDRGDPGPGAHDDAHAILDYLLGFLAAAAVSLHYPMFALAMICTCLAVYLKPQPVSGPAPRLASEDTTIPPAARRPSSRTERCPSSPESRPQQRPNRPA
jgi:hypothetical protein